MVPGVPAQDSIDTHRRTSLVEPGMGDPLRAGLQDNFHAIGSPCDARA
ncbi:hypothetical protein CXY01_36350 [Cellulomonas xylanilytica]|uniref:Uncharacterized protein n=1 Tax=Cellulomonas xylanilytica TaxID=233583 RepID=A0A510VD94_9CELL|nr:hypothetical protein CXY01_36350 [Cellulomonas xylanilytica]